MLKEDIMDRKEVIGPSSGEIGVTLPKGTKISLMLLFNPNPIQDAGTLTNGGNAIEVRVVGYDPDRWCELSEDALNAMAEDKESLVTRKIASAVLGLLGKKAPILRRPVMG